MDDLNAAPTERSPLLSGQHNGPSSHENGDPSVMQSLKSLLFFSPVNILLIAVPFSFASYHANWRVNPNKVKVVPASKAL